MKAEAKYGGIRSSAVKAKTGKDWDEWVETLYKEKAEKLKHKEIAELLYGKYKLDGWWAQMVTVGFEQAAGLRVKNQKADRGFSVSVSKVMNAELDGLFSFFTNQRMRRGWLTENFKIRTQAPCKSLRADFGKKTANLSVMFYPKGENKSSVVITESKLNGQDDVKEKRLYWRSAVERLQELIDTNNR